MVHTANFFITKVQAAVGLNGKEIAKSLWEKVTKITRDAKEACHKGITKKRDWQLEEVGTRCPDQQEFSIGHLRYRLPLQMYRNSLSGYARRVHKQFHARNNCRTFLWSAVRTGPALGFASLFLIPEESGGSSETECEKRWNIYNEVCENISNIFTCAKLEDEKQLNNIPETIGNKMADFKLGDLIAVGCNGAVYEAELKLNPTTDEIESPKERKRKSAPKKKSFKRKLAVKVIYNFHSSNAGTILNMVQAELVTSGRGAVHGISKGWQNGNRSRMKHLPLHPNIIRTSKAFIDKVPKDMDANHRHPATQPPPTGFGRSTTMFLVFPKYEYTLNDYIKNADVTETVKHLLCLQLLQGVKHLEDNGVAHRDLKGDNILIRQDSVNLPWLVISDFGCCIIADHINDLTFPFLSWNEDNRNGAPDISPPEISGCLPGSASVLDYRKSDAWAVGLLIKGIMGFDEQEPSINKNETTFLIYHLMMSLLNRDMGERISCAMASIVLHLQMFGPIAPKSVTTATVCDWLLLHSAETMAYRKTTTWGCNSVVCNIFSNFLSSVTADDLSIALNLWETFLVSRKC